MISGNNVGLLIIGTAATGNQVLGNFIGTDITGTLDLGNSQEGVRIDNAPGNTIGGTTAAARNVISANHWGVVITGPQAIGNVVQGNFIGTDDHRHRASLRQRARRRAHQQRRLEQPDRGVARRGRATRSPSTGGTASGSRTRASATPSCPTRSSPTSSWGSTWSPPASPAVDRPEPAPDRPDPDVGRHLGRLHDHPGTLASTPNTTFTIQFFVNSPLDPTGQGEGGQFVGQVTAMTGADGIATYSANVPTILKAGQFVTATATDPLGNTSEFSAPLTEVFGTVQFQMAGYTVERGRRARPRSWRPGSGGSGGLFTVDYATADGSAQAGSDYQATSGTLTFNPGEDTQTFTITDPRRRPARRRTRRSS